MRRLVRSAASSTGTATSSNRSTPPKPNPPTLVHQLEQRLSESLGEQAWHQSGLGVPDDIDQLKQQIGRLEPHTIDLRLQLEERDDDLAAARAADRGLMAQLNTPRDRHMTIDHSHVHHTCCSSQIRRTPREPAPRPARRHPASRVRGRLLGSARPNGLNGNQTTESPSDPGRFKSISTRPPIRPHWAQGG
jgi:hypothetical protein